MTPEAKQPRRRSRLGRTLSSLALGAALVALTGDRAHTAGIGGIDPLEILSLLVKPNVIVVLDSSTLMRGNPGGGIVSPLLSGDWEGSKMFQAKRALKEVILANETKASFLFGQYTQTATVLSNLPAGAPRFFYTTTNVVSPSMAATELTLTRTSPLDTTARGHQAWQDIRAGWNTLYWAEGATVCTVAVPPGFYQLGGPATTPGTLAQVLQTGMNAATGSNGCVRAAVVNTYSVTFDNLTGAFTFTRATGAKNFRIRWADIPNSIRGALGSAGAANTALAATPVVSGSSIRLLSRTAVDDGVDTSTGVTTYWLTASRFFNGETYDVLSDGTLCGKRGATTPTNPPTVSLQQVSPSCPGIPAGPLVVFTYSGGQFAGNTTSCSGFTKKVNLVACNSAASQAATINPFLEREIPLSADGLTLAGGYGPETLNGAWSSPALAAAPRGIPADGATPIAAAINNIKTLFNTLWNSGQTPGPPVITAIKNHNPKEGTIVMFVTGGDDTCAGGTPTNNALTAARSAELLYAPIVGGVQSPSGVLTAGSDPASSVTTYVVGFGSGASPTFLNWIAWGGSGMTRTPAGAAWASAPTAADRANCATCQDAFNPNNEAALKLAFQAIIDQASTAGSFAGANFTAQQSIVASVFELLAMVTNFHPDAPTTRYDALVPIQFQASFDPRGFRGKLQATQAFQAVPPSGPITILNRWEAGQKLMNRIALPGGGGTFSQLHANATDATIRTSAAGIKRRIYTTTRNGSFSCSPASCDGASPILNTNLASLRGVPVGGVTYPGRTTLWPPGPAAAPAPAVAPPDDTTEGLLDVAMGLPSDAQIGAGDAAQFMALQTTYKACRGATLPPNCLPAAGAPAQARRARREAREMILAYTAGADFVPDMISEPARVTAGVAIGEILYKARNWLLAESTLAPPALVAAPIQVRPGVHTAEYGNYMDGVKSGTVKQNLLTQGFGLANPDLDTNTTTTPPAPPIIDTGHSAAQRPVMTVVYLGANDMLHAFRAGPSCGTPGGTGAGATYLGCSEQGGEELWGFVPYDRLIALKDLMKPQTRLNKTYVIAAALRFADVFVDAPGGTMTVGAGLTSFPAKGMWRQVLVFGRGPGGKFMTALDITGRGPYTTNSLDTTPPIVFWSRGNPDTQDGTPGGPLNNDNADKLAYDKMGETWSVPAIASVDRAKNVTARRPYDAVAGTGGVPMVAYMGSGYCSPCNAGEGTTFFTLDVTTGDVVAAVDVELEAANAGVQRTGLSYVNALVSSPAAYSASAFNPTDPGHPAERTGRVYIGDLHGRLWKFLSSAPSKALLLADLGADQPVGTAPALLGLSADGIEPLAPFVFVTSGNDNRRLDSDLLTGTLGPFKMFGFKDAGDDITATYGSAAPTADPGVKIYSPATYQFSRAFDLPNALPKFRGTIAPATALNAGGLGRVFFGGTRGSSDPCGSSFDSIVFALTAVTGGAAYDLNASGDDAYKVFTNSRKLAIQVIKQPSPSAGTKGKGVLMLDEGLMGSSSVQPPPAQGLLPQIPAAPNVGMVAFDPQGGPYAQLISPRICQ